LAQCLFPGLAIFNANILLYIFQIKYAEAILPNSTQKLLWFEITKMLTAVEKKFKLCHFVIIISIVSFIVIFSTLPLPMKMFTNSFSIKR